MLTRERLALTGKQFYCVCFSIRSGSSFLCEDLMQWGVGEPTEWFQFPNPALDGVHMPDHLVALVEGIPGDHFGFKIAWDQAYDLAARLRRDGDESAGFDLRTVFPDLKYLHVVRRDKLGQAVSAWRAQSSGTWHWPVGTDAEPGRPSYDFEAIKSNLQKVLADDWLWPFHFEEVGIQPFTVGYEDYVQDRLGHLDRVVDFLGARGSAAPLEERLHVMRDDWTLAITERFRADLYTVADPLVVRSIWVTVSDEEVETNGADQPPPAVPSQRRPASFGRLAPIYAPVGLALGVSAADAALPQVTLAPLLIAAPVLAGFLVSPPAIAIVTVLAAILMVPLGIADDISDSGAQFWIIAGILIAGLTATWISWWRRRQAAH